MAQDNDRSAHDFDDDTWHHGDRVEQTIPPGASSGLKDPGSGSTDEPLRPAQDTVAGAQPTPPPFSTAPAHDSADVTPKPSGEPTDDWHLLPAPTIKEGEVVFGKYLLEKKIGAGGMGEVWLVENVPLQRESALKLVKPEIAQNNKGWKRFEREARLMAKITHPNAVAIYDFRRSQSMGYIEMEFVPGRSLEKILSDNANKPMPLEWTAQLLDQLCSVLQEAHGYVDRKTGKAKPIIHRDLKPSNLMLVEGKPDGQNLKVLDFGIAKMVQDEASPELTGQNDLVGTPYYMSPEQIQGGVGKDGRGELDGRSDLYSVGVLLYQLLTGTLPFWGRNKMEVLVAHLHQTPRPMDEANPEVQVPPKVERLVMSCLERDPDLRPRDARELAEKFRAAIGDIPRPSPGPRQARAVSPVAASIAATALLVACVLGAWYGWSRSRTRLASSESESTKEGTSRGPEGKVLPPEIPKPPESPDSSVWTSLGYETLRVEDLRAIALGMGKAFDPGKRSLDPGATPAGLRHKQDRNVYYAFAPGIYLPLGYLPEDPNETVGLWPRALVRESDQVRFIRIVGGSYTAGDFRAATPVNDSHGNPCQTHQVKLSGFYIQETEVTNREIKAYRSLFPDARGLESWKKAYDFLGGRMTTDDVDLCPAVCIDRATAQKYARAEGGRLPTEAEWEYAARSCGRNYPWACSSATAVKKKIPKAHLLSSSSTEADPFPRPVKPASSREDRADHEDRTDQGVLDMTGNVREWCFDVYQPYAALLAANKRPNQTLVDPRVGDDPDPAEPKVDYVVRGGSILSTANEAMVFLRTGVSAESELSDLGFRLVIPCPPEANESGE